MKVEGKVVVVTGAAHGIGAALARRLATEGAAGLMLADVDEGALQDVAAGCGPGAHARRCDVSREADIVALVEAAETELGAIDLFCSNAGIVLPGGVEAPDEVWRRTLDVNFMAHLWAARAVVPRMVGRGGGYLLQTASAAGLLTQLGSATYSVTKHAVIALAEWLAITHGDAGLKVSVLAPQGVRTNMTAGVPGGGVAGVDGMLEPAEVADVVVEGLDEERFLILPHPMVAEYFRRKAADYDRWIGGMRRLQRQFPRFA